MPICKCPIESELPSIGNVECPESFGQIQKVAFANLNGAPFFLSKDGSEIPDGEKRNIVKKTAWTAKLAGSSDEKIIISPYIEAPTADGGAARTFGGGNETLGGIEVIIGREPTSFSGVFRMIPQTIIKKLKAMQCISYTDSLGVFLFDENGSIGGILTVLDSGAYDAVSPIPIRSLFFGDKTLGGLEAPDSNAVQWSFLPNWSDDLVIVAPEFNPLTDLKNT